MHTAMKSRHKKYKDSHSVGKGSHSLSKSPSMKRSDTTVTRSLSKSTSMKRTNVTGNYVKRSGDTNVPNITAANSMNTSPNLDRTENSGIMNSAVSVLLLFMFLSLKSHAQLECQNVGISILRCF